MRGFVEHAQLCGAESSRVRCGRRGSDNGRFPLGPGGAAPCGGQRSGLVDSSLAVKGGSVLRSSHDIAPDAEGNQLFIQEFGCVSDVPPPPQK